MRVVFGLDQLHIDVHAIAGLLHAAFEHIADVQLARDLRQIFRGTAVARGGSPRNDAQPADPRERGDDFILNTLREKGVFLVRAEVLEWQHSD